MEADSANDQRATMIWYHDPAMADLMTDPIDRDTVQSEDERGTHS
jgi:hypothetical protein